MGFVAVEPAHVRVRSGPGPCPVHAISCRLTYLFIGCARPDPVYQREAEPSLRNGSVSVTASRRQCQMTPELPFGLRHDFQPTVNPTALKLDSGHAPTRAYHQLAAASRGPSATAAGDLLTVASARSPYRFLNIGLLTLDFAAAHQPSWS